MINYSADLEWLKITYPEEYAKIPQELLTGVCSQIHMEMSTEDGTGTHWIIAFYDDDNSDLPFVEFSMERPEPETLPVKCPHHTLLVSRPFCPDCRDRTN